ncbi:MAG: helix-turn-helix domain-containing protein [Candidatus Limnocylindria bacterium]
MRDLELGRLLRMLRIRRAWRLRDMAGRCGLSRATIGRHELGSIGSVSVIRTHAAALDIRVEWRVVGRGSDVARLLDEEHAAIVETLAARMTRAGWQVEAEASFSEYGAVPISLPTIQPRESWRSWR